MGKTDKVKQSKPTVINAKIRKTSIYFDENNKLEIKIVFQHDQENRIDLYWSKTVVFYTHTQFIEKLLNITYSHSWDGLPDKFVRLYFSDSKLIGIGHIIESVYYEL